MKWFSVSRVLAWFMDVVDIQDKFVTEQNTGGAFCEASSSSFLLPSCLQIPVIDKHKNQTNQTTIQGNGSLTHVWTRDWPLLMKGHASGTGSCRLGARLIPGDCAASLMGKAPCVPWLCWSLELKENDLVDKYLCVLCA